MNGRILGAVVLMLGVGAAGGYVVAVATEPETSGRSSFTNPEPVVARDPSYPVIEVEANPDPTTPALATDLPLRRETFKDADTVMTAPVPGGWYRAEVFGPNWNFSVLANPKNTYLLRIGLLSPLEDVRVVRDSRISALRSAEQDGNLDHLAVEPFDEGDPSFTATYLQDGFLRVVVERFLTAPGSGTEVGPAFVTIAMTGREVDRDGMNALLDEVEDGLRVPQRP